MNPGQAGTRLPDHCIIFIAVAYTKPDPSFVPGTVVTILYHAWIAGQSLTILPIIIVVPVVNYSTHLIRQSPLVNINNDWLTRWGILFYSADCEVHIGVPSYFPSFCSFIMTHSSQRPSFLMGPSWWMPHIIWVPASWSSNWSYMSPSAWPPLHGPFCMTLTVMSHTSWPLLCESCFSLSPHESWLFFQWD